MAALGFRHGFDWDHIAAITDITSTTSASHTEADVPAGAPMPAHGHEPDELRGHAHAHEARGPGAMHVLAESRFAHEERHAIGLATLYAFGHAFVVVVLGVAALLLGAVLPAWVDPILQRVVGVTLVLLGVWVLFSVYQYLRGKGEFRLRSRWMLVFDFIRYGWGALQARIHGHGHTPSVHATQYGPKTAFGVGMIHGVGAETGSQALLLAGIAGVTGVTGPVPTDDGPDRAGRERDQAVLREWKGRDRDRAAHPVDRDAARTARALRAGERLRRHEDREAPRSVAGDRDGSAIGRRAAA